MKRDRVRAKMQNNVKESNGFTLIELLVVMIIVGLILGGFSMGYQLYLKERLNQKQQENFETIQDALAAISLNGIRHSEGVDLDGDGAFEETFSGNQGLKVVEIIDTNGNGRFTDAGDTADALTNNDYSTAIGGNLIKEYYYIPRDNSGNAIEHNTILAGFSLPCPAPLNAAATTPQGESYDDSTPKIDIPNTIPAARQLPYPNGQPTDCNNAGFGYGFNADAGIYRVRGIGGGDVLIGAVPYVTLGIPEKATLDAYNNRIFYAVSANMTQIGSTLSNITGSLEIKTDTAITTGNGERVTFTLFSAGEDGAGAFDKNGIATGITCPNSANDQHDNCDFTNDTSVEAASFLNIDYANTNDNDQFDDTLSFTFKSDTEQNFFTRANASSDLQYDIVNKNPGDIILQRSMIAEESIKAATSASIGSTNPAITKLDVAAEMKVSMGTLVCDSANPQHEGAIRYNSTKKCLEFCDSTGWQPLCQPGCVDGGTRYADGETRSQSTPAGDGCSMNVTTLICDGEDNDWISSSSTDSSACGCEYGGTTYSLGQTRNEVISRWKARPGTSRCGSTTTYRILTCSANNSWQETGTFKTGRNYHANSEGC